VFLLVPAHPRSPGQTAVKRLLLLLLLLKTDLHQINTKHISQICAYNIKLCENRARGGFMYTGRNIGQKWRIRGFSVWESANIAIEARSMG